MGKYTDMLLKSDGSPAEQPKKGKWSNFVKSGFDTQALLDAGAQPEMSPDYQKTGVIDTRNSEMRKVWLPREDVEDASFATHWKAGWVNDLPTKIDIYSKARFPNLPKEDRVKRYGVDKKTGKVVYLADDGNIYPEARETIGGEAKQMAADIAARPISTVAGTAGAAIGPGMSALMAAGGRGYERLIGDAIFGGQSTGTDNAKDMLMEAIFAGGSEMATKGMVGGVNARNAKKAGDIVKAAGRDRATINAEDAIFAEELGRRYGIDLYPPQTTESRELINNWTLLQDLPNTAKKMTDAQTKQMGQVETAVYNFLDTISPETSRNNAGRQIVKAGQDVIDGLEQKRTRAVSPMYQEAYRTAPDVDIEPVLNEINGMLEVAPSGNNATRKTLTKVKGMLLRQLEPEPQAAATQATRAARPVPEAGGQVIGGGQGPRTLRGRIREAGGVKLGSLKGDLKESDLATRYLTKRDGVSIDSLEQTLKEEGWLFQDESLLEIMRTDPERLRMPHISEYGTKDKPWHEMTPTERKFAKQMEYEPEAPPDGDYSTVYAENLKPGDKRAMITPDGNWDEYRVVKVDGAGATLKDGQTIQLDPWDRVQVLDKRTVPAADRPQVAAAEAAHAAEEPAALRYRAEEGTPEGYAPENRLETLDLVKKEIDAMLDGPEGASIAKDTKWRLSRLKDKLTHEMDRVSPLYKDARQRYQDLSFDVDEASKGLVGAVSRVKEGAEEQAFRRLFSAAEASPENMYKARRLIKERDPEAWNSALRYYMQDAFESIKAKTNGDVPNLGGWYQKTLFGNKRQKQMLQAALEPEQYNNLKDFMEVLRRTGLTYRKESTTATRQVMLEDAKQKSGSRIVEYLENVDLTKPASIVNAKGLSNKVQATLFGKYNERLADAMLSKEATRQLAQMKMMPAKSKKLLNAVDNFIGLAAAGAYGGRKDRKQKEIPIPAMKGR